jgi:hypothetical protein
MWGYSSNSSRLLITSIDVAFRYRVPPDEFGFLARERAAIKLTDRTSNLHSRLYVYR